MKKLALLAVSHLLVLGLGFCLGIYLLPILAAPPAPSAAEVQAASASAGFKTRFIRQLAGSDALHWGEGDVAVGPASIALMGRLAPGPAYRLYLVPGTVETGEQFLQVKAQSFPVADVRTFENFIVPLPAGAPLDKYQSVVIWCESFQQFITSGRYR